MLSLFHNKDPNYIHINLNRNKIVTTILVILHNNRSGPRTFVHDINKNNKPIGLHFHHHQFQSTECTDKIFADGTQIKIKNQKIFKVGCDLRQ